MAIQPGLLPTSEMCQDIRQLHSHFESFTAICSNRDLSTFIINLVFI